MMQDFFEYALDLLMDSFGGDGKLYIQGSGNFIQVRVSVLFPAKCAAEEGNSVQLRKHEGNVLLRYQTGITQILPGKSRLEIGSDLYTIRKVSGIRGPGNTLLAYELELLR